MAGVTGEELVYLESIDDAGGYINNFPKLMCRRVCVCSRAYACACEDLQLSLDSQGLSDPENGRSSGVGREWRRPCVTRCL